MNSIGIIRRVDDLGRVVIPKEVRRTLRIREGDPLEFYVNEKSIVLQKYSYEQDYSLILNVLKVFWGENAIHFFDDAKDIYGSNNLGHVFKIGNAYDDTYITIYDTIYPTEWVKNKMFNIAKAFNIEVSYLMTVSGGDTDENNRQD